MTYLKWCFLCFTAIALSQNSKQVSFCELTVEQGLSQNSVISIAQDSTGFMWFATQDGLNKYDGKSFDHFLYQFEDITRSTYSKLGKVYVDQQNQVWIITNSGMLHKKEATSETFKHLDKLKNVSTLIQTANRDYYLGTYESGVYKIDAETQDTLQILNETDRNSTIYDLFSYKNQVLASTSNGILKIDNNTNYQHIPIETQVNFSAFAASKKHDRLFVGSYGKGLFMANGDTMEFKPFEGFANNPLPQDLIIQDILIDSSENLWIATYGDGAYLVDFNQETIQHFVANKTNPFALHYNDVLCLYEDFTGIVWLGTDGSGLSYYDEDLVKFNVLTNKQAPDNVSIDFVRAIAERDGYVWLGTSNKGLTAIDFKTDTYRMYTTNNSTLESDRVMSLYNQDGTLWVGHQNSGLQKLVDNDQFITFEATEGMSIWKIYEAVSGRLWLCTLNGLVLFDETQGIVKRYNSENSGLSSNAIRTVEAGAPNTLWIGTESGGLYHLNTQTETISRIEAIPDRVKSLYYHSGILWIGTNGNGLKSYDTSTKSIQHFTTAQGLANNVIYGILPDNEQHLWLSSNKGLTKVNVNKDTIVAIENFSNYDGLQTNEFNTGAYFKDDHGILYFGGLEGLNWFDPSQISYNSVKPKTVITGFDVFAKPRQIVQDAVFPAKDNTMTFTFSSLHYSQPDRNHYKYQLENHDPDWISSGNTNTAHYTNLPPNDYNFKVMSSNYDGVWNDNPVVYSFTIKQPWYSSILAIIGYFLLFTAISIWVYRYLKWRWHMQTQLKIEHAETERLKKLDDFKTKLYTNISHEFRTPLTLISGPIEHQLSKDQLNDEDREELNLVKQNANRLLKLVNQMLDLSLVDSGQLHLEVSEGNLQVLLQQIVAAFTYTASDKQIRMDSTINNLEKVWYDPDIIEKIVTNLLSNAIKYAPDGSQIIFDANQKDANLVLSVVNTNKHISNKNLGQLFQRFYQGEEASEGIGVGLSLVKELVTLSNGTIIANTIDTDKIQFTVTIPVHKDAFKDFEIKDKCSDDLAEDDVLADADQTAPLLLIVEDDGDIRKFVVSLLKQDYQIIEAANGESGVEKALKYLPDVVISDIMMPVKDGIALCNELKHNELTSHIPIILLTAKAGEENEIEGLKIGADAYLTKPFNSEKLKLRIKQLIEVRLQLQKYFSHDFTIHPEIKITSTEANFLKKLKTVLESNITNTDFTSERFAKAMQMSRTKLHRKLKAIVGMSTSECIRAERLKLAVILLEKSDATISEIAYQVGFNSPSYFIKCFKEVYNTTPSEYQSQLSS
ncbi:MAG: response regulator [Algicola sp.]|nr:response regulator [Algicola sp.]